MDIAISLRRLILIEVGTHEILGVKAFRSHGDAQCGRSHIPDYAISHIETQKQTPVENRHSGVQRAMWKRMAEVILGRKR